MRLLKRIGFVIVGLAAIVLLAIYIFLRGSLPQLDGKVVASNLSGPVSLERDAQGVVTITASNRADLAYATGYAHGQDRLFQMDLQRRLAAGELSELLGKDFVDLDKRFRRHDFRDVARQVIAQATAEQQKIVDAYVAGVNAAREAMSSRPFEYLLLQSQPAPWTAEDCVLVAFAMYIDLNDSEGAHELERAQLHSALPQAVFDLLYPRGTKWDATLDDSDLSNAHAEIPGAEVIDLRAKKSPSRERTPTADADYPGSNNFAIAGRRTANGSALVANDMHLGLRLPHIWYRARLVMKPSDVSVAARTSRDLTGVTLPGLPILVAGSNGHIAWGFTNSQGDYDDLVLVATNAEHPNQYRNGDRYLNFGVRHEQIKVRDGAAIAVDYRDTIWGPLLDATLDGKLVAVAWTAQRAEATNFRQLDLETATTVVQALDIANTVGIPVQNFVAADDRGHIGWTLIGKLPKRSGYDGRLPECWGCAAEDSKGLKGWPGSVLTDKDVGNAGVVGHIHRPDNTGTPYIPVGWTGWVEPKDYPRILDPYNGQLWSANSRTLGSSILRHEADVMSEEGMDRGARAQQIRDDLSALKQATPMDLLKIQLDDRALFLKRWADLLVRMQDEAYLRGHATRRAALKLVAEWSGRASVDDAGYRIVRAFRAAMQDDIYRSLIAKAQSRYPDAQFQPSARFEDTAWRIMTTQPANFLDARFDRWDLRVLDSLDRALAQLEKECDVSDRTLAKCTWGRRNELKMEHPLAAALPLVGRLLSMPRDQLPGDNDMPRVQAPSFGASERFAVSPGHEAEGYFHMPGGQSGHPLSPFFSAGHEAWVRGEPTPFLPGVTVHRLELSPP